LVEDLLNSLITEQTVYITIHHYKELVSDRFMVFKIHIREDPFGYFFRCFLVIVDIGFDALLQTLK